MVTRKSVSLGLITFLFAGLVLGGEAIPNWPAPASWSPPRSSRGVTTQGDITSPLPFIGVTPCRQYDSRNATALPHNTAREVVIRGAPCGIPLSAVAVSLNVTVFDILGQTGNAVFQVGTTSSPTTAWINYPIGQGQIGNAGVLPLSGAGSIFFRVQQGAGSIDFTIDVNGYYASQAADQANSFKVVNSSSVPPGAAIWGETRSGTSNVTGVFGVASAGFGSTLGVLGLNLSNWDNSIGVGGISEGATGKTFGVYGKTSSTTTDSAGIYGEALNSTGTGKTHGVHGVSNSQQNGSGVYGVDYSGDPASGLSLTSSGVRGGSNFLGVLGISTESAGIGVAGASLDSAGNLSAVGYLGRFGVGVYYFNGLAGTGPKSFVEPHPTDASKAIRYVSLEGPEAGTYFRGRGRFQRGLATIEPPEDFRIVTDAESLSIQVTPIGDMATVAVVRIGLDGIVVKGSRDVEFFYTVNGVRRAYSHWDPIPENQKFFVPESSEAKLPKYLSEEERARLVANRTYNPDGTVNMETAERLGWAKAWKEREEQANAAAAAALPAIAVERR
jgi:hypothetical protein